MAEAFKEIFNHAAIDWMAALVEGAKPDFDGQGFRSACGEGLAHLELMQRVDRFATCLAHHLPDDFTQAVAIVVTALGPDHGPASDEDFGNFRFLPFARFVSANGLGHPGPSLDALEHITKRFSAEFDIRPFLRDHPALTLDRIKSWARHHDWRVRRLATEGTRPRLPWGLRLHAFIADPAPVLDILDMVRADANGAVRRSVANNLNDIAKDHPDLVVATLTRWHDQRPLPDAMRRHALRSLIKQGHSGALSHMGFSSNPALAVETFSLSAASAKIGDEIKLHASLRAETNCVLSIDYAIHHQRANGKTSAKIFKLARCTLAAGESWQGSRAHSLKPVTVRRYYPGLHRVVLLVNGREIAEASFVLEA